MYVESFTVRGWKRYECAGCGCVYRCRFERRAGGGGNTPKEAHESAVQEAVSPFEVDRDRHPCPQCGLVQPRVAGLVLEDGHFLVALAAAGAVAVALILRATGVLNHDLSAVLAASMIFLSGLGHWMVARQDPNGDLEANRARAATLSEQGKMSVVRAGSPAADRLVSRLTPRYTLLLVAATSAAALAILPPLVKAVGGWHSEVFWWGAVLGAAGMAVAAGWGLSNFGKSLREQSPPALVERLDGPDGHEVILLSDESADRNNLTPPPDKPQW